jgi:hypothetical protein
MGRIHEGAEGVRVAGPQRLAGGEDASLLGLHMAEGRPSHDSLGRGNRIEGEAFSLQRLCQAPPNPVVAAVGKLAGHATGYQRKDRLVEV